MNQYFLLIETSTDICSVGISDGEELLTYRETERSFSHSEVITLFIAECLSTVGISTRDLKAVCIADGPGSYTALRIGSATAKGICYASDIPLITINTLTSLANAKVKDIDEEAVIVPLLDARRMEVYQAVYDHQLNMISPLLPKIIDEHSFQYLSAIKNIHFVGDGVEKCQPTLKLQNAIYHDIESSVRWMPDLALAKYLNGDFSDIAYHEPNYFKAPNITVSKKKLL